MATAQAQRTTTASVTASQSFTFVQSLLSASISTVAFLRELLPEDNFGFSHLVYDDSSRKGSLASKPSISGDDSQEAVSKFRVMTVKESYTSEGDKLMELLDRGVGDALEKQYLRTLVFAIYLDDNDPNNIVEAYSFNFAYNKIPGTDIAVPTMTLDQEMTKLSLGKGHRAQATTTVTSKKQNLLTLGDVKKVFKTTLKKLRDRVEHLEDLPRQKRATFKLIYYDHTPDDYIAPGFIEGDEERNRFYFATHGPHETPEKFNVGTFQTGWHGVNVDIQTVSSILPSQDRDLDDQPFLGMQASTGMVGLASASNKDALALEVVLRDAEDRKVLWRVLDEHDIDADGEIDPDYVPSQSQANRVADWSAPMGLRQEDGTIVPVSEEVYRNAMDVERISTDEDAKQGDEALFVGASESVPRDIDSLNMRDGDGHEMEQTQPIYTQTEPIDEPSTPIRRRACSFMDSEPTKEDFSTLPSSLGLDTQMMEDMVPRIEETAQDSQMLDLETQAIDSWQSENADVAPPIDEHDSIQSFTETQNLPPRAARKPEKEDVVSCDCGVHLEDCDTMMCEQGCGRWFHAWCMGYHSGKDRRIPEIFTCFECRIHKDPKWALLVSRELDTTMLDNFVHLALFRRAIKVAETHNPANSSTFTEKMGCDTRAATQAWKRLETEGFIACEVMETDELGLLVTPTLKKNGGKSKTKQKGKTTRARLAAQKGKYVFVPKAKRTALYADYFDPSRDVEDRLLGLKEMMRALKGERKNERYGVVFVRREAHVASLFDRENLVVESQTQDETQLAAERGSPGRVLKRRGTREEERASKRTKMSVTTGIPFF